jgi:hypothetical protein
MDYKSTKEAMHAVAASYDLLAAKARWDRRPYAQPESGER